MNKHILVITDKPDCNWIDKAARQNEKLHQYDLLILGLSSDGVIYANEERFDKIESLNIIDVNKYAESAQEKIRKFIPGFIYEFPRKDVDTGESILKLFRLKNINFWWFSQMSEKGALVSPLIKRIYYLELVRNVILAKEYQEIWAEIEDVSILTLLKNNQNRLPRIRIIGEHISSGGANFWLRLFTNIFLLQGFYLCRYLLLKFAGFKEILKIKEHSVLFFTFYPYFWSRSNNGMTELFFQALPDQLNRKHPVCYIAWLKMGLRAIWKKREGLKGDFKKKNIFLLETSIHLKDFISTFFTSLLFAIKVFHYRLRMEGRIKEQYEEFDITNIIVDEIKQFFITEDIVTCVLIMKACNRTVKHNKIDALIYRIEFQPYEKALIYGARSYCTIVAFQHQALARNHLQYFFPKSEISSYYRDRNNLDNLPLPDYFLLAGAYPFEILKNSGFPEEVLSISGPVRYAKLIQYLKTKDTKNEIRRKYGYDEKEKVFLIASPVTREDVYSFMLSLSQAVGDIEEKILFLFKSHPIVKFDKDIVKIINEKASGMKYRILRDDINLNDYLSLSDALILTGTTVGIEAISLGVVPILFENNSSFSLNPLLEIRDSCLCVRNAPELRRAILSVIKDDEEVERVRKNWPSAIKKLFYSVHEDPNSKFIGILKRKGIIS